MTNIQNPDSKFTNLNSTLSDLLKADQDRILDLLDHRSYREVLEEINQPAPEGLALKIHSNSLRKFYLKHLPTRLAEERPQTVADWKLLSEQAARDPIDFQDLIRESLEREVYLAFLHSEPTNSRPIKLMQCLLRWRSLDLRQAKSSTKRSTKPPASPSDLAKILASEKIAPTNYSFPASTATTAPRVPEDPAASANANTQAVPKFEPAPVSSSVAATTVASANLPNSNRLPQPRPRPQQPGASGSASTPLPNPLDAGKSSPGIPLISGAAASPESFQPINLDILKKAISMVNAKYGIPGQDVPSQPFPLLHSI